MLRPAHTSLPTKAAAGAWLLGCAWLAGCAERVEPVGVEPLRVTNAALAETTSTPMNLDAAHRAAIVGSLSCAASGCHGKPAGSESNWDSAYSAWVQRDPHRNAFEVLYTERSVQMFRKLTQHQGETIEDETYLRFLEQKCVGCHATPVAGSSAAAGIVPAAAAEAYALGVNCESCHGAAGDWLHRHYLKSWPAPGQAARASLPEKHGFHDTASLVSRAGVCVDCHVGPQVFGKQVYDVNHDLIAAGHPRMAFEFAAYFGNLPPHWNVQEDQARHAGSFHFDAWRAGQLQAARQQVELLSTRAQRAQAEPATAAWPEFASYDCYDCHHALGEQAYRQGRALPSTARRGLPRPALVSLTQASVLEPAAAGSHPIVKLHDNLAAWSLRPDAAAYQAAAARLAESSVESPLSVQQRAEIVVRLVARLRSSDAAPSAASWDEMVQAYLAAKALASDSQSPTLTAPLTDVHERLQAALSGPTQYDSPSAFAPADAALQDALDSLENGLRSLGATTQGATTQGATTTALRGRVADVAP